jgi:Lipid A 3-O-deacylase (PagL)
LIFWSDISLRPWTNRLITFLIVFYSSSTAVRAQESRKTGYDDSVVGISFFEKNPQVSLRDPFSPGSVELEFLGGGESSSLYPGARRPKITFLQGDVRVGMIISQAIGCSFYRGNFEILLDGFAAGITDGPGSWLAGGRVFGRYNFTQPGARIIPYLQVNGGALGNDIYRDHTQKIIGGGFEFTTGVSVGLRFLVSRHFGLLLEGGYQHTSNGDIYLRNAGLNTLGAQAGLFYSL